MADCKVCDRVGGPLVSCTVCGLKKGPAGRSVAMEVAAGYCDFDCPGNALEPHQEGIWPGERYGDVFGHKYWHEEVEHG